MLKYGSITPDVTVVFADAIRTGVLEAVSDDHHARTIGSNILRPALADIEGIEEVQWGLSAADVAQLLRSAAPPVRRGALEVSCQGGWKNHQGGPEAGWHRMVAPFFERVWPPERQFRDSSLTPHLIDLAVGSGDEFPAALRMLRPYISPYDKGHGSLHGIDSSKAPERFPRETLDLLWLVCGPESRGSFYEISAIIDKLIEADSDIEIDRRLQWLEQRAERLD